MPIEFDNILFPTDFSDVAQGAFGHAREVTNAFDARLHCLHVVDEAYQYWSAMGPESIPVGPPPDDLIELARARMEKFAAEQLTNLNREPITYVTMGRPFAEIIGYALTRLRYKLEYTAVGFQLLPEEFTLPELQVAYETILGEELDKANFRKKLARGNVVEPTGRFRQTSGRPAELYRYREDAVAEVKARRLFP